MLKEDYLNKKDKLKELDHISDILALDYKLSMDVLERAEERINELSEKYYAAFTESEKNYIKEKIELLTHNYQYLKEKIGIPQDKNIKQDIKIIDEEDTDTRKVGLCGRSYDSGLHGYTRKEVLEIEKLIPDIHQ